MAGHLLDTSVAIELRDAVEPILDQIERLAGEVFLSVVSLVELEGGIFRDPTQAERRRKGLDTLLEALRLLPFGPSDASAYGGIVAAAGYSRRRILDRMIAAQALAQQATLVTLKPDDFADVPGLDVLAWESGAG